MSHDNLQRRLNCISTDWSVVRQAHEGHTVTAASAQELLVRRYGEAVRRYLLGALRDPDAADDLAQEFALCLVRGEFRYADPQRGRFRDYVKVVLMHLVSRCRRSQKKEVPELPPDSPVFEGLSAPAEDLDRLFDETWRADLLAGAWHGLADAQPTFYAVLRHRAANPKMPSGEMATQLSRQLGMVVTAVWVRQTLHQARQLFAALLLDQVAGSLHAPTAELIAEELRDLRLLDYCKAALERRQFPGA